MKLQSTCSYSTIIKLLTLEDVIRDTVHSLNEIKQNIHRHLSQPSSRYYTQLLSEQKQSLVRTQVALQSQEKSLETSTVHFPFRD